MRFRLWFLLGAGLWSAVVPVGLLIALTLRDRLPPQIAIHWDLTGHADRSMPPDDFRRVLFLVWLVIVGIAVVRGWRAGIGSRRGRRAVCVPLAGGGIAVLGLLAVITWANLDVAGWRDARPIMWLTLPLVAAVLLAGVLGSLVARLGPDDPADLDDSASVSRPRDTRMVWVSVTRLTWVRFAVTAVGLVILVGLVLWGAWASAIAFALTASVVIAVSSVRVRIGTEGVWISLGPQRFPTRKIPVRSIARARVEHRNAWRSGGFGYRSWARSTTVMVRGGECLVLDLRSGDEFAVSIDGAGRCADLINSLLADQEIVIEGKT